MASIQEDWYLIRRKERFGNRHTGMIKGQREKVVSASQEEGFKEEGAMSLRLQTASLLV